MTDARLRLRSVKFKNGATLHVFHRIDAAAECRKCVLSILDTAKDGIAGVAIVAWTADGSSAADMVIARSSPLLSMQVPDFVRNRLMAAKIEEWTRDGLK